MERRPILYLCGIAVLASCGQGGQGQLIGVQNQPSLGTKSTLME